MAPVCLSTKIPRKGRHAEWGTLCFNYGRAEVRSFLIGSAIAWLDRFGVDGFRVDAVASMLYLDYARQEGEWCPNQDGGNENYEAIDFIKQFNQAIHEEYPHAISIAEESTLVSANYKATLYRWVGL